MTLSLLIFFLLITVRHTLALENVAPCTLVSARSFFDFWQVPCNPSFSLCLRSSRYLCRRQTFPVSPADRWHILGAYQAVPAGIFSIFQSAPRKSNPPCGLS